MRKILEYSEFVSGESIKDKLMALEKKWVDTKDEIYAIADTNQAELSGNLIRKYGELARQLGKLIPLDSDDAEKIAKKLYDSSLKEEIGYIVHYLLTYHFSGFDRYPNYTDITPIKWTEVK